VAIAAGIQRDSTVRLSPLLLFVVLQGVRIWIVMTLGRFWTTRVITMPDEPLVATGPYRYLRHPNYLVVTGEIATLPLVFGQMRTALVFSLVNFAILSWRIRVENAVLEPRRLR
jgi:methyltransferase